MAKDAADMKPKFIPNDELLPRDDSGGPGFEAYTAEFGDGGRVTGAKSHLSVTGGGSDSMSGDEISKSVGSRGEPKPMRGGKRD
jgi:hypothetical protein